MKKEVHRKISMAPGDVHYAIWHWLKSIDQPVPEKPEAMKVTLGPDGALLEWLTVEEIPRAGV